MMMISGDDVMMMMIMTMMMMISMMMMMMMKTMTTMTMIMMMMMMIAMHISYMHDAYAYCMIIPLYSQMMMVMIVMRPYRTLIIGDSAALREIRAHTTSTT